MSPQVRLVAWGGGAVAVMAVTATAALGLIDPSDAPEAAASDLPPATAEVVKTTLVQTESFGGTLGYGDAIAIQAKGSGVEAGGTITWLPEIGATIKRGQTVYRVDEQPIVLLYGDIPLYRILRPGLEGTDVELLEQNLAKLGYTGFTVDDSYTDATASAVRDWQQDLGRAETGQVTTDQVVITNGAIRVAELSVQPGATASGQILLATGTSQVITVALDVADQQMVSKDHELTVELPDGARIPGTVAEIGTVATATSSGNGPSEAEATTIDVVVTVDDQEDLGGLDSAPVEVILTTQRSEDVLAVPIGALVALAEGGYGVQLVEGNATRYVAVQTGMFANGRVEISGAEISAGVLVGVPA